jgi:2-polyprenyl-3-methyl-5-hydroxy-6-metoxy-1,4-benzoquinol methylase
MRNDDFGDWKALDSSDQTPRYQAIAGMIERFSPKASVLDVGCGEAVLKAYLPQSVGYFGVEPSAKAVQAAHAKYGPEHILHSTAEDFEPGGKCWDCIVFNEVLYYTSCPLGLLSRYSHLLRPGGMVIVSVYQKPGKAIKARLRRWVDHRSWTPNILCTKKVDRFMASHGWLIQEDMVVPLPGGREHWRIWRAEPPKPSGGNPEDGL